jgi:hypothetical protein
MIKTSYNQSCIFKISRIFLFALLISGLNHSFIQQCDATTRIASPPLSRIESDTQLCKTTATYLGPEALSPTQIFWKFKPSTKTSACDFSLTSDSIFKVEIRGAALNLRDTSSTHFIYPEYVNEPALQSQVRLILKKAGSQWIFHNWGTGINVLPSSK